MPLSSFAPSSRSADRGGGRPSPARADARTLAVPRPFLQSMSDALDHDVRGVQFFESRAPERLGARAFARAREVHFAPGEFDLDTHEGRRVVGHELAHVVQQARGRVASTGTLDGMAVNDSETLERDADRIGRAAVSRLDPGGGTVGRDPIGAPPSDGFAVESAGPAPDGAAPSPAPAQMWPPWLDQKRQQWNQFKQRHLVGPHDHEFFHPVLPDTPDNQAKMAQDLYQHPVPGPGTASPEGNVNFAAPVGYVTSTSHPESQSITNTTVPGRHLLHPGTVTRNVESRDGQVGIHTRGTGTGLFPSVNDFFAPYLWGHQADKAKERLDPEYAHLRQMQRDAEARTAYQSKRDLDDL